MKAFAIHKPVVFPLITILGSLSAMLADAFSGWVLAAGFLAVSAMLLSIKSVEAISKRSSNWLPQHRSEP